MNKKKEHHGPDGRETVSGMLIPAEWDDQGRLTGMMLSAFDDEEYLIENSQKFIELAHQNIEASGIVRRNRKSFRTINIKKFSLIDPPSVLPDENE